jgi:hypothetical protein
MVNEIQLFCFVSTVVSFKLYTAATIILQALYYAKPYTIHRTLSSLIFSAALFSRAKRLNSNILSLPLVFSAALFSFSRK